jgi:hypothetical protein
MSLEPPPTRLRPRFGRVAEALAYAAVSRSRLYEWRRARPTLFRKNGSATLVDFRELDLILDALPIAALKATPAQADDAA